MSIGYLIVLTRALTDDEKRVYECAQPWVNVMSRGYRSVFTRGLTSDE